MNNPPRLHSSRPQQPAGENTWSMRTFAAVVMVLTMILVVTRSATARELPVPADRPFLRGDTTGDGNRELGDAVVILNYLKGRSALDCLDAADVNDDGRITNDDVLFLLEDYLKRRRPLPSPGIECGPDPTDDALGCAASPCPEESPGGSIPNPTSDADPQLRREFKRLEAHDGATVLTMRPEVDVAREDFFTVHGDILGLDPEMDSVEFLSETVPADDDTFRSTKYQQLHHGLRVIGAEFVLVERYGRVVSGLGRLVTLPGLRTTPRVQAGTAIDIALSEIGHVTGLDVSEIVLAEAPRAELVITSSDASWTPESYAVAWRCELLTTTPLAAYTIDIDAFRSKRLYMTDGRQSFTPEPEWIGAQCTGQTLYDDLVNFYAEESADGASYRLRTLIPYHVETLDNKHTEDILSENDFISATRQFPDSAKAGVSAHWAAWRTLFHLDENYGYHGVDGEGAAVTCRVDFDQSYDGAHAILQHDTVVFGDYDPQDPVSWASLDVVAHEVGHLVTRHTADLVYAAESGALNESFSDILATLVEFETWGPLGNWSIGEDLYPDTCCVVRWMDMPKKSGGNTPPVSPNQPDQPTTFQGTNYAPTAPPCNKAAKNDSCGVHINSGVQNRWFYLLSEGGIGNIDEDASRLPYEVQGIGKAKAGQIAFRNLTTKLVSSSTFLMARDGATAVAKELYGEFSQEHASVENAWYAVGVGKWHPGFVHSPVDGSTNVSPWPATIRWEAGDVGTGSWDFEISTAADFTTIAHESTVSGTTNYMGHPVGSIELDLKPETTYYWRVREHNAESEKSWRPVKSFTTDSRTPITIAPQPTSAFYYPWNTTFVWEAVPGAQSYELEVSTKPNFRKLIYPAVMVEGETSVDLVTKVGRKHFWRVRAYPADAGDNAGAWAETSFDTMLPPVTLATPLNFGLVYPWAAEFRWNPVMGATKYLAEISTEGGTVVSPTTPTHAPVITTDSQLFTANILKTFEVVPPDEELLAALNVPALKKEYWWRVKATGPMPAALRWELPEYSGWPETVESKIRAYVPDAEATTPEPEQPGSNSRECRHGEENIEFVWKTVKNATSFGLTCWHIINPYTFETDWSSPAYQTLVDAKSSTSDHVRHHHTAKLSQLNPRPGTWGYVWQIKSYGPEGLEGYSSGSDLFWVVGDRPTLISPSFGQEGLPANAVKLSWKSQRVPSGKYLVKVRYYTKDDYHIIREVPGTPGTETSITLKLKPDRLYEWSVEAEGPDGPWIGENANGKFRTAPAPEPEDESKPPTEAPKVPGEMFGVLGRFVQLFSVVPGADSYRFEIYRGAKKENGGFLHLDKTYGVAGLAGIQNNMTQLYADLGEPMSSVYGNKVFATSYGGNTMSGETYYYRVSACNADGCGPPSNWSKFQELSDIAKALLAWNIWANSQ